MSKALWVLRLPKKATVLKAEGEKVSCGDELARVKGKVFQAPVRGKIVEIAKNKIKLEFPTEKISGKGFGVERCWGKLFFSPKIEFFGLDISHQGKILFIEKVTPLLVKKAIALGIAGFICYDLKDENNQGDRRLPILIISKDPVSVEIIKKAETVNCLLDVSKNCLLIPNGN